MSDQPDSPENRSPLTKPLNLTMKFSLVVAVVCILISVTILTVILPLEPENAGWLTVIGSIANYLVGLSAVGVVIGALMRHFGK